ncbi:variable surface lipoprotein [Mycoplasma phocoeninasale]|uniref:Variable surface lipoprotein n=1 Tax=Mycoplasma phocoeninasale TaxID=2726117 RepID=A0A858U2H6_9MOLU|nr:variable surface lipoprotein [Mycoplasma phocoeninasale]MBN0970755.1 variable surface lipoprotein [Mycoplasma phocoeninasale]QJG66612.1 variable surface lipoprotein [Mycoplasma phocoeninasale]
MKKRKIFLSFLPIVAAVPLIAVSCKNTTSDSTNNEKKPVNPRQLNLNQEVKGFLSASQLEYVKNSFQFNTTKEGRNLSAPERNKIIGSLIQKYKSYDSNKRGPHERALSYKQIMNDPEFKKYFEVKMGRENIWGHPVKIYFETSDITNVPCISFSVYCPSRNLALETTDTVNLEIT